MRIRIEMTGTSPLLMFAWPGMAWQGSPSLSEAYLKGLGLEHDPLILPCPRYNYKVVCRDLERLEFYEMLNLSEDVYFLPD